ncbi:protein of unknown function [Hyphomicrobium sp. 1Nfss2.1]|uniref:hypothetical protein n=1 Tax=Hyphomicrobium sp. 1Nfss2.1 TaxID=3413936 RepID=UPI003C7A96D0
MNASQVRGVLYDVAALAALAAAGVAVLKAFGIGVPVQGSIETWTYVAVACAAAKLAR